jgi:DNA-binding MarR family transcriptional regulator
VPENINGPAKVFTREKMRLNLQRAERRVLLLLQQKGPMDAEDIADELHIPLGEVREAIGTLSEEDLVITPDQTVAELTDVGEKYDLLCDESIDDELSRLKGDRADILRYIQETKRQQISQKLLEIQLDRTENEISEAMNALEALGYPVGRIIS